MSNLFFHPISLDLIFPKMKLYADFRTLPILIGTPKYFPKSETKEIPIWALILLQSRLCIEGEIIALDLLMFTIMPNRLQNSSMVSWTTLAFWTVAFANKITSSANIRYDMARLSLEVYGFLNMVLNLLLRSKGKLLHTKDKEVR